MTALPSSSDYTAAGRNEGQGKAFIDAQRGYLAGLFGTDGVPATALATLGALGATYAAKTGAYTVVTGDRGKVIACSGTWTLGLTAVATLGAGYSCIIANTSTGTITIDPASAELIDGAATFALGPLRMVLIICTGSAWLTLALAGSVTTSSTDTTAGRLLKVGDFGIASSMALPGLSVDDAILTGTYLGYGAAHGSASGGDNPYPSSSGAFTLNIIKGNIGQAGEYITQIASLMKGTVAATTAAAMMVRSKTSLAVGWSAWQEVLTKERLLGTVSQTGGIPTGKVIERGSNANGEYVRFADGTQICTFTAAAVDTTTAAGAVYMHTNLLSWTFPAAFAVSPVVAGGGGNSARWFAASGSSVSSVSYRVYSYGTSGTLSTPSLTAIGRWF